MEPVGAEVYPVEEKQINRRAVPARHRESISEKSKREDSRGGSAIDRCLVRGMIVGKPSLFIAKEEKLL